MAKLDRFIDNKMVQNLFIWFVLYLFFLTAIQFENRILVSFYVILLLAPTVYFNNLIVLPLWKKNKLIATFLFILNAVVFSIIPVWLISYTSQQPFQLKMFVNFIGIIILALLFASALKIARDSFARRQEVKQAELHLLKAQLNPHFLFNTLNNLYGLAVIKSDILPGLMLQLSDLLRYSLYDTKEPFVSLEKEIKYLENYISLERIRLEDLTKINFKKSHHFPSLSIAPMLFIVFVENAFKHLGNGTNQESSVSISLEYINNQLIFNCTNTVDSSKVKSTTYTKDKSGIGLQNIIKRLTLLYPNNHWLEQSKTDLHYSVHLKLSL